MVVVLLAPVGLILVVALAAVVVVGRSSVRITSAGVEIHNYPQDPKLIPLAQVDHFAASPRTGNLAGVRPATAVLVLVDGARLPVRTISSPDAGRGIDALNSRLDALRRAD